MRWAPLVLFGPAIAWGLVVGAGATATLSRASSWRAVALDDVAFVGDARCRECHLERWQSWHRSYHRTMTQPAANVAAPFAGETLATAGFVATMDRDREGRPHVRIVDGGGVAIVDANVELAVGSHRYQQYVARIGAVGELWRLPVAWHIGESRWIHMGSAFLEPDPAEGDADEYLRHLSRYNDNCIFCHNTDPVPGLGDDGQWHSSVAQWGIACEACHGPADAHVQRHRDPLRRVLAMAGRDGSIVDVGELAVDRGSEVCGRCHGQRIGHDIAKVLRDGDGFVPGTPLAEVSRPIFRASTVGDEALFAARFWPDDTPRLSAHEYQALVLSPCWNEGQGMGCAHCHDMHGDEPAMQLRSDWDPQNTCTSCHGGLARDHGGHGDAIDCTSCHMPRTTYGLLQGMISHRITSPDPGARADVPDACTQCHVDRTRRWAAESMASLGLRGHATTHESAREAWGSRIVLDLVGGDPIQRALAADALARPHVPADAEQRMSWLVEALVDDYGAVRWMAWRAAKRLAHELDDAALTHDLTAFDPAAPTDVRLAAWRSLRERLGPAPFSADQQLALEAARDASAIVIGE
ncbi:MAG TPA: hypothetical protein VG755_23910 [Nannocystaceae bacterium]|nr:hypothetical protein [Nannocystaceae bacterium]